MINIRDAEFSCSSFNNVTTPFGELRRCVSGLAVKQPGEIARAHSHAIRQGGYAEILPRVTQDPGLQFADVWAYCACVHGAIVIRDRIRDKDKDPSFSAKQIRAKD